MATYRFSRFTFDSLTDRLQGPEGEDSLRPQTAQLLMLFLDHPQRLLTKQEIIDALWGGDVINEQALFQGINQLRKALGENAQSPKFLKTIPRKGYCWICDVEQVHLEKDPPPRVHVPQDGDEQPMRSRSWLPPLIVIAAGLLVWILNPWKNTPPQSSPTRLALVPFLNQTGDPDMNWIELGLMEMVQRNLKAVAGIASVPTDRVLKAMKDQALNRRSVDPAQQKKLSEILSVAWVIHAKLSREDDLFSCRITGVSREQTPWEINLKGPGLPELAQPIAEAIAQKLNITQDDVASEHGHTDDPFVNRSFAQGLQAFIQGRDTQARPYFEICVNRRPEFLPANLYLARCYLIAGDLDRAEAIVDLALPKAKQNGQRSLQADFTELRADLLDIRGQSVEAIAHYDDAVSIYREIGVPTQEAMMRTSRALLHEKLARPEAARADYQAALELYAQANDAYGQAEVLGYLASLAHDSGQIDQSLAFLQQSKTASAGVDDFFGLCFTHLQLSDGFLEQHKLSDAREHLERATALFDQIKDPFERLQCTFAAIDTYIEREQFEDAEQIVQHAEQVAVEHELTFEVIYAILARHRIYFGMGDLQKARELADNALEAAKADGLTGMEAEARLALFDLELAENRLEQAEDQLSQVDALLQPSIDLALRRSKWLWAVGQPSSAIATLNEARARWPGWWDDEHQQLLDQYTRDAAP